VLNGKANIPDMKPTNILFIILTGLVTSCYKVYDPQVGTAEKVLVVDGLMTNQTDGYYVVLTYWIFI
jgi:hypothetical protein